MAKSNGPQSILMQRVHWAEALRKLDTIRTSLVHMLTHMDGLQRIQTEQEIFERTEEARGHSGSPRVEKVKPK